MDLTLKKGKPTGVISAPPSKSFAHRYLIGAMLSGNTTVGNLSYSQDVLATLDCLNAYGASFLEENDSVTINGTCNIEPIFNCNESGSTLRFFIPIAMSKYEEATFTATSRLLERGIDAYEECLKDVVEFMKVDGALKAKGKLVPKNYIIDGSKSSQYISGMLFALPLLNGDSTLTIKGELNSKPYIDMTIDVLKKYGIEIKEEGSVYSIKGNQTYKPLKVDNEGDYSNAAFLSAFNYLGGELEVKGLNPNSLQGDRVYINNFKKLSTGYCVIDCENCIDLSPVMFSLASLLNGAKFINTKRLAIKESNRAVAMKQELEKAGAHVIVSENEVIVEKAKDIPTSLIVDSHNDHRIAMAMSLYATKTDITIQGYECVSKSYPDYFDRLEQLGMEVIHAAT